MRKPPDFLNDPKHPLGVLYQALADLHIQKRKIEADYKDAVAKIDAKAEALKLACKVLCEQYDPSYVPDSDLEAGVIAQLGMTDRIRAFLYANPTKSFTPKLVRDLLTANKFNLKGRSNPMAEVHTVLKRLVASGEVEEVISANNAKAYRWALPEGTAAEEPQAI
jgi:hypothetical protein